MTTLDRDAEREWWARAIAGQASRLRVGHDFGADDADRAWPSRLPADVPYAVRLASPAAWDRDARYGVLALDFDASRGDVSADVFYACELLDAVGIAYVVCASSGANDGGRHVFIRLRRPASVAQVRKLMRLLAARCPTLDIAPMMNPRTGSIRPPLAPHRSGGASRILTATQRVGDVTFPVDADGARAAFEHGNSRDAMKILFAALRLPMRSKGRQRLDVALRELEARGKDRTPSAALWRIALEAHHAGYNAAQVLARCRIVNPLATELLTKPHTRGLNRIEYELEQVARKPLHTPKHADDGVIAQLREYTRLLDLALWRSQHAFRVRETLRVLLARAARAGTLAVTCSQSELAAAIGCNTSHASELLTTLCSVIPTIHRELPATASERAKNAAVYHLTPLGGEKSTSSTTAPRRGRGEAPQVKVSENSPPTAHAQSTADNAPPEFAAVTAALALDPPDRAATHPASDPRQLEQLTSDLYASHVGGVGPRGHQIVQLLAAAPRTAAELTDLLALTDQRHVRRYHLARLVEHGIVAQHANGTYYLADASHVDDLAWQHGCTARAARRRARTERARIERERSRCDEAHRRLLAQAHELHAQRPRTPLTRRGDVVDQLGIHSPTLARAVRRSLAPPDPQIDPALTLLAATFDAEIV